MTNITSINLDFEVNETEALLVKQVAFDAVAKFRARQVEEAERARAAQEAADRALSLNHRNALKVAFKALRKKGVAVNVSIQSCCVSCAELPPSAKGKPYVWTLAWRWREAFTSDRFYGVGDTLAHDLYLYWGHDDSTLSDESTLEVGEVVTATLREFGLVVDWDGDAYKAVCVKMEPVDVAAFRAATAAA